MTYTDRVRFADVDFARVPFYGRYFSWIDRAWEQSLNDHGIWYGEMVGRRGIGLPIVEAVCRYLRPLALDDDFAVHLRVADLSRKGLTSQFRFSKLSSPRNPNDFTGAPVPAGDTITEGHVGRRFVDTRTFRGIDLPDDLYALFEKVAHSLAVWAK